MTFLEGEHAMLYRILLCVCILIVAGVLLSTFYDEIRKKEAKSYEGQMKAYKGFIRSGILYVVFTLLCLFIFTRVLIHGYVPSGSMIPTLNIGDHLIINGLSYTFSDVERGDIVVFYSDELGETLVKRVVGLPGDEISFYAGDVYINGELYDEEYLDDSVETYCTRSFTVPDGCYFFMGDNRSISSDARYWANPYIPKEDFVGKVICHFHLKKSGTEG